MNIETKKTLIEEILFQLKGYWIENSEKKFSDICFMIFDRVKTGDLELSNIYGIKDEEILRRINAILIGDE